MHRPFEELTQAVRRWRAFEQAARQPVRARDGLWARTAALLGGAPFWRTRLGGRVPPLCEFPITDYADYAAAIESSWESGVSRISGEPVVYWSISTGFSGPRKLFPWTRAFEEQHRLGSRLPIPIVRALARGKGPGPLLVLAAASERAAAPNGVPVAYLSNYLRGTASGLYPAAIDTDKTLSGTWLPLYALAADLGAFRAVSGDHVFMILDRIEENREFYLSHLRGQGERPPQLPAPRVSRERLALLTRVLRSTERLTLGALWPNLRLVHTWRAAAAGLQAAQLVRTAGVELRLIDLPYVASEGPVAAPIDPDEIGGPMHPASVIHEFLEAGAPLTPGNVIAPWELEPGRCYEVLLTTLMGLVRYRLKDIVRCTGRFHQVPTLRFERRATSELSLGMMTVAESELVVAMEAQRSGVRFRWAFGPSEDGRALVLYTTEPIGAESIDGVHRHLAATNETYLRFEGEGRVSRVREQLLPREHPMWTHTVPAHAQSKPVILFDRPPSSFEPPGGCAVRLPSSSSVRPRLTEEKPYEHTSHDSSRLGGDPASRALDARRRAAGAAADPADQ